MCRLWAALTLVLCISTVIFAKTSSAQLGGAADSEGAQLVKKLSNPISDLVSLPFRFNWERNVGTRRG